MNAFDKVIGYEKEKEELSHICDILVNPHKYAALGVKKPRGLLLHGLPGVGKTLMASSLIEATGRKCFTCRKNQSENVFVQEITDVFARAKENAPSVVFLDDVDKFAADEHLRNPDELVTVQTCMDETKDCDVFVVATCNHADALPRSLRRAGRFDFIMAICPPTRKEAEEIVRYYIKDKKIAADVDVHNIARMLDGNTCALLEAVLNEAGIYAGYENKSEIGNEHIKRAILRSIFDTEEYFNSVPVDVKEEVACHEAGHAAAAMSFNPDCIGLISVRRGKSGTDGVTQIFKDDDYFADYGLMRERVVSLLAGKAAVELRYGRTDVGATSDLKRASKIVERFVTEYAASGFGFFRGREAGSVDAIDYEVVHERNRLMAQFYDEARRIVHNNWELVRQLTAALVERDTLTYDEIAAIRDAVAA